MPLRAAFVDCVEQGLLDERTGLSSLVVFGMGLSLPDGLDSLHEFNTPNVITVLQCMARRASLAAGLALDRME